MPRRKTPLVTNQVYHVFNRGVNKQPIFFTKKNYKRAVETIKFYSVHKPPIRYSKFLQLALERRAELKESIKNNQKAIEVISYLLMPNHYHFILKQTVDDGIRDFIRNFQISYTRYTNIRHNRSGPLLQGQFKAVLIEDEIQLNHVDRYIHLNPHTSFVVKDLEDLKNYTWSSLPEYMGLIKDEFCSKELILSQYRNSSKYWEFIVNHADYQRKLEEIKHLIFE